MASKRKRDADPAVTCRDALIEKLHHCIQAKKDKEFDELQAKLYCMPRVARDWKDALLARYGPLVDKELAAAGEEDGEDDEDDDEEEDDDEDEDEDEADEEEPSPTASQASEAEDDEL